MNEKNRTQEKVFPQNHEDSEFNESATPDSYDAHIIPAETAARKEREGDAFKHVPEHPAGSDSIDTTGGFTVDKEGLANNFAVEPDMYYETPGDLPDKKKAANQSSQTGK